MKKSAFLIFFLLVGLICSGFPQEKMPFSNYQEMRKHVGDLYNQKRYGEAAELLREAINRFPDHLFANSYNLALMYGYMGEHEKGIKALLSCLEQGLWFGKYAFFNDEAWGSYKKFQSFQVFLKKNEVLWKEAQKKEKPDLVVVTPEGYDPGKEYPLFIALHGGNSNVANFRKSWVSQKMKTEFIVAFVQSSQLVAMDGYSWTEDIELSKREIADAYLKMIKKYPVRKDGVIVGGFSSGGVAALEVVLNHTFPVAGFISLCPAKPESFTTKLVREAKNRGIKGTILTTEMDPRLPDQKEMNEILKTEDFPCEFIITPDIGHWFPEDLDVKIDNAIRFILGDIKNISTKNSP
jgi:predicted esterase